MQAKNGLAAGHKQARIRSPFLWADRMYNTRRGPCSSQCAKSRKLMQHFHSIHSSNILGPTYQYEIQNLVKTCLAVLPPFPNSLGATCGLTYRISSGVTDGLLHVIMHYYAGPTICTCIALNKCDLQFLRVGNK